MKAMMRLMAHPGIACELLKHDNQDLSHDRRPSVAQDGYREPHDFGIRSSGLIDLSARDHSEWFEAYGAAGLAEDMDETLVHVPTSGVEMGSVAIHPSLTAAKIFFRT